MGRRTRVIVAAAGLCAAAGFFMGAFGQSEGPVAVAPVVKGRLDLNRASPAALERLPGISPQMTERIIRGRPYRKLDDLITRRILGRKEFARIKGLIVVRAPSSTEKGATAVRHE